jgi:hypothetical protein
MFFISDLFRFSRKCTLISGDDRVSFMIGLPVNGLPCRICIKQGNGTLHAFRPGNFTFEFGHKAFDLVIVEDNTVDLVTDQGTRVSIVP